MFLVGLDKHHSSSKDATECQDALEGMFLEHRSEVRSQRVARRDPHLGVPIVERAIPATPGQPSLLATTPLGATRTEPALPDCPLLTL